jgi:hypothetical protein
LADLPSRPPDTDRREGCTVRFLPRGSRRALYLSRAGHVVDRVHTVTEGQTVVRFKGLQHCLLRSPDVHVTAYLQLRCGDLIATVGMSLVNLSTAFDRPTKQHLQQHNAEVFHVHAESTQSVMQSPRAQPSRYPPMGCAQAQLQMNIVRSVARATSCKARQRSTPANAKQMQELGLAAELQPVGEAAA